MTQTMDLNKMGLTSMSNFEMQEVDGGGFWDAVVGWLVGKALDNIPAVAQGVGAFAQGASDGSQVNGGIFFK